MLGGTRVNIPGLLLALKVKTKDNQGRGVCECVEVSRDDVSVVGEAVKSWKLIKNCWWIFNKGLVKYEQNFIGENNVFCDGNSYSLLKEVVEDIPTSLHSQNNLFISRLSSINEQKVNKMMFATNLSGNPKIYQSKMFLNNHILNLMTSLIVLIESIPKMQSTVMSLINFKVWHVQIIETC